MANSTNRMRQLSQIQRHDQMLFVETETALSRWPDMAESIITNAMLKLQNRILKARRKPASAPTVGPALYDLTIAITKYGYGTTCNGNEPIKWIKKYGQKIQKFRPRDGRRLTDPDLQEMLLAYDLVETEVHDTEVVQKYRKLQFPGDGGRDNFDDVVVDKNRWPWPSNVKG